ncbi:Dual specificity phosphatase, catalytic domain [Legionella massiliensis]|uniref:Dual specificity phosphatase, catalytic domain n=1 Tax=Legionella massiliensis TaxID=1034943 RepID=A0A078L2I1_9GAMM|nr:protein-tyrosine phosphatase family protein [Legionella massiliensis]CDZ78324.1 Dual specificity phosphatase, catalytic domain [Legionella massiliensis]CEE14062.1 Dual specificity phosphatase, catalytic domain [Legionella massiliensis]
MRAKFERYFFKSYSVGFGGFASLAFMGSDRGSLSTIVDDRIYLSNMSNANQSQASLIVSCVDIVELARSDLLLEPNRGNSRYHVLAMEDRTALTGCIDQIVDTILLMSEYADKELPIHIHCYAGVGRSAMMTAIHIAWRYMNNDPLIKKLVNSSLSNPLDPNSEKYITHLYTEACRFVKFKRSSCQFDDHGRAELAELVLSELKIRKEAAPINDENYSFLAELVQSIAFKKLQHKYFNQSSLYSYISYTTPPNLCDFFDGFLSNNEGWYKQLFDALYSEDVDETNPLYAFSSNTEFYDCLEAVFLTMTKLAERYPNAQYSQMIREGLSLHQQKENTSTISL